MPHQPGLGYTLSKLGAAAREAWLAANSVAVRADAVRAGDVIVENNGRRWKVQRAEHAPAGRNFGRGSSSIGIPGQPGYRHSEFVYTVMLISGSAEREIGHPMTAEQELTRWDQSLELPPEVEAGTRRTAEMNDYIRRSDRARQSRA